MAALPGAEPFSTRGVGALGRVGILLSHGFTGTPASMRPWAEHLATAGYSIELPLLPGHGTSWQHMNSTGWPDWYGEIERSHAALARDCDEVFAIGLSMGGTLVTRLAERLTTPLAGLVLVNPAFGSRRRDVKFARPLSKFVASRPGLASDIKKAHVAEEGYGRTPLRAFVSLTELWKLTVADLSKITAPVQLFRSTVDHVVDDLSVELLHAGATATTVEEITLHDSYHVATLDNDAGQIFSDSLDFIGKHSKTGSERP